MSTLYKSLNRISPLLGALDAKRVRQDKFLVMRTTSAAFIFIRAAFIRFHLCFS